MFPDADVADWATNAIGELALAADTTNSEALEPQSLSEAKSRPDWKMWEKAIDLEEELETLQVAGTWKLVQVFRAKKAAGEMSSDIKLAWLHRVFLKSLVWTILRRTHRSADSDSI